MQCSKHIAANQIIVSQIQLPTINNDYKNIRIKTLNGCELQISQYKLLYNAEGGRGAGSHIKIKEDKLKGQVPLRYDFDMKTVHVPPLTSTTAKFIGLVPLPPFFQIDVIPEIIQGKIYQDSGKVEIKLKSKFLISMGSSHMSPLHIDMILTTEELKGELAKNTQGKRLGKDGQCKLVGVARVEPTDDKYINMVLHLPSECLASLKAIVSIF